MSLLSGSFNGSIEFKPRPSKVLVVNTSTGSQATFDKFKTLFKNENYELKSTNFDEFMSGKRVASFDIVLLANFDTDMVQDDFETQAEMFDHYANAPISAFLNTVNERCPLELPAELEEKMLRSYGWDLQASQIGEAIDLLNTSLDELGGEYDQHKENVVRDMFQQFDKDGSGAIDTDELKQLCAKLGSELDDEQVQTALVDLDLDKSGDIDFEEFCRWYFSGMKSYSSNKRTMLSFKNGMSNIVGAFGDPELNKFFRENKETITQSVGVSFNKPEDPATCVSARINILGDDHDKWLKKAKTYMDSLKVKKVHSGREIYFYAKCELETTPEAWAAFEPVFAMLQEKDLRRLKENNVHLDICHRSQKLVIQYLDQIPDRGGDFRHFQIPQEFRETLKGVDQFIQIEAELDTCPEEVMKSDKPLLEHALGGFNLNAKLVYNKHLAKIMDNQRGVPENFSQQFGFLFKFGVDSELEMSFDDADDLREHPMLADKVDISFNQIFQMIGKERANFEDSSEFNPAQFDQSKLDDENKQQLFGSLTAMYAVENLVKAIDQDGRFKMEFDCVHEDIFHAEVKATSAGVGALAALGLNAFFMEKRMDSCEMLKELLGA